MRPAMSLAFTFTESTSFFTLDTSPLRHASNSSLKAPVELSGSGEDRALLSAELEPLEPLLSCWDGAGPLGEAGLSSPSARGSAISNGEVGGAEAPGGQRSSSSGLPDSDDPRDDGDRAEFGCCC